MLKTKESIESWLKEMNIQNYVILENLSINVDDPADLSNLNLKKIPVQFNIVKGNFYCDHNQLETLEGAPQEVRGDFWCSRNQLKSLKGAPQKVGRDFYCSDNKTKFTVEDVKKVCNVKERIIV